MSKMIFGNFTFYSKASVWQERNVEILNNIKSEGYAGGNNSRFITSPKDCDLPGRDRPSLIATALPITEDDYPRIMSFTGELPIPDYNDTIDGRQKMHYSSADYYDSIYHFGNMVKGRDIGNDNYFDVQDRMNVVALQGLQFNYNTSTCMFDKVIECKGHRKANGSGRGCADVWNGIAKYFTPQDYASYRLE